MERVELVEGSDRWELRGLVHEVWQLRVDHAIWLVLNTEIIITIEGVSTITRGSSTVAVEQGPAGLVAVLERLWTKVSSVTAFKDGRLEIVFGDDAKLDVPADDNYEPWGLVGDDGMRIVSVPGGGLAVWLPGAAASVDGTARIVSSTRSEE